MRFSQELAPCKKENTIIVGNVRISVLSPRTLRIEKGSFTDNRTQFAFCRDYANPQFKYAINGDEVSIETETCFFNVNTKTLSTSVTSKNGESATPSNAFNLGGTARTLDGTFGLLGGWKGRSEKKDHFCLAHIRKGIFALNGVSEIDDSASVILNVDGSVSPRPAVTKDKYVFAFGKDYLGGLKEFYSLSGFTPLLPKYVLGNWWSRYHAYTDKEYLELMDKFEQKNVPLTVATIDMDWHIVNNVPKDAEYKSFQGAGWTGYTFEKELFPDPEGFLQNLKSRNLAVTMNLHPRDGVRYFEEQYPEMCRALGVDPQTKRTLEFDLTDEKFRNAYFDILHHPYEKMGVDFWWIDWQQGTKSKMKNLDPLWLLNHYHTLDINRDGRGSVILSRYAGLGSHRYPLGFSGDTFVCWNSLKFQPYFTALASNAGYTWWSHDIGGHLFGKGDNELYLRWLQYGVFSPINRLHSSNKGMSKEPWNYTQVETMAENFLRLRHRLLPYLYTANVKTATEGVPLVCPTYYYSQDSRAYDKKWRNQYYFGAQMYVCPVTHKGKNGVAKQKFWLPSGVWFDFFTGERFEGGKEYQREYPLDKYPVFVKEGAIIPLLNQDNNSTEFKDIELKIYLGNNVYTMFDEQGKISVAMRKDENGYDLIIIPENVKTERLTVSFANVSEANIEVNEQQTDLKSLENMPCKPMKIRIENAR